MASRALQVGCDKYANSKGTWKLVERGSTWNDKKNEIEVGKGEGGQFDERPIERLGIR